MDPFSIALDAGNVAGACAQAAVSIVKICGDVRTADGRTRGFYDEVIGLRSTYEALARSLETAVLLEAARVTSRTAEGAQLWDQARTALGDSLATIGRINQVLDQVRRRKGTFTRKAKTILEEAIRNGELYRPQQRVQFINVALALPIKMLGLMLQLEQADITVEHERSLEATFASVEQGVQQLLQNPDALSKHNGAMLTVGAVLEDDTSGWTRGETYSSFARKMLSTAAAAASARSRRRLGRQSGAASQQVAELGGSEPREQEQQQQQQQQQYHVERSRSRTIPDWIPPPEMANEPQQEDANLRSSPSSGLPSEGQRVALKSVDVEVAYKLTQQHLKLGQERADRNEHESAEKRFRKALELLAKHDFSGRIVFQPAEVMLMIGRSCLEQSKYDEAIELVRPIAEQQAKILPREIGPAVAGAQAAPDALQALAASQLLGEAYKLKGDYDSAKEHALRAFLERTDRLGEEDVKTRESVCLLIEIFRLMGDDEEAEAYQIFLRPESADRGGSASSGSNVLLSDEPAVFMGEQQAAPAVGAPSLPTPSDGAADASRQRKSSRPSFTQRLKNMARPSQSAEPEVYGSSPVSRFLTRESAAVQDGGLVEPSQTNQVSSPSDTSHDRSNSFVDGESGCSTSMGGRVERSASIRLLEPEFLAVEQLCTAGNYDQASKIALKFLEGYGGANFIIRRDELERNVRKGDGKGLASTGRGYSPLHYMCELKEEHTDEVCLMLKYGADVNATASKKASYGARAHEATTTTTTPLQLAIDRGHAGIAQLLLDTPGVRTDVNAGGNWFPLLTAGRRRQYGTVRLLLKHGGAAAIPQAYPQDYYGCSPLHDAAKHCDLTLVELLLEHGHVDRDRLQVDVPDRFGKTPLMHAIIKTDVARPDARARMTRQRRDVVETLLRAGADVHLLDRHGHSARWYAEREDAPDQAWLCRLIGETSYEMMA